MFIFGDLLGARLVCFDMYVRMENSFPLLGDAPPIEADEKFQRTHEDLVDMLTKQCEVYEQEDHALRVLMEEEVLEKLQSHQNKGERVIS